MGMSDRKKEKLLVHLCPGEIVEAVAQVMQQSLVHHPDREEHDWQTVRAREFAFALERHFLRWKMKEAIDPESGYHHLRHIAANCAILLWFLENKGPNSVEGWQP